MNLVCLDSHYFIWALLGRATLGQEDMIGHSEKFLDHLDETKATIVVPTPIITELLMEAEPAERAGILQIMRERFHVVEYDIIAAKIAAEIWNTKKRQGVIDELRKSGESMRTKIKVDTQILGTALAANVNILYTQDQKFTKLADGLMIVRTMPIIAEQIPLALVFPPNVESPTAASPSSSMSESQPTQKEPHRVTQGQPDNVEGPLLPTDDLPPSSLSETVVREINLQPASSPLVPPASPTSPHS